MKHSNCKSLHSFQINTNQKFFILVLSYTFTVIIFLSITLFDSFLDSWDESFSNNQTEYHIFVLFNLSCSLILPLTVLLVQTLKLLFMNRKSIENNYPPCIDHFRDKKRDVFKLNSLKQNYFEVFGHNTSIAFFPIWSTIGDRMNFRSFYST